MGSSFLSGWLGSEKPVLKVFQKKQNLKDIVPQLPAFHQSEASKSVGL